MDPLSHSRYMRDSRAQFPLRLTDEMIRAATYEIENVDANIGYQAGFNCQAARRWVEAIWNKEFVWLGISGAATPAGLGGLIADMISLGLIDVIVSTGANVYHDLHFAYGLPVRQGTHQVDDNKLREDKTTRIYTQFIHNEHTLKTQDIIVQEVAKRILPKMKHPFSTATFNYEFGKEMMRDPSVIDKKGSFVSRAAEFDVPLFLDSGSNHSLGMNLALLSLEGLHSDTSPSRDVLESAALSMYSQDQLNVFLGEGGPRNFAQTTAPTVNEIAYLDFGGSNACIRFSTGDERTGGLSGSGEAEAVSWGKYKEARPENDIQVWGEYTLSFPTVAGYVAGKVNTNPKRLMKQMNSIVDDFVNKVKAASPKRDTEQRRLMKAKPELVKREMEARKKAGYVFGYGKTPHNAGRAL